MSRLNIDMSTVTRIVNLGINAVGLLQDRQLHHSETKSQRSLAKESIEKSRDFHKESQVLNKKSYLVDLFVSLEQHFQQLNADLVGSSKESQRDMFDQRNQQLQTIILSSSVMFSALSTVIIQGPLNAEASSFLIVSYSVVCSLSFAALFITIVICMEIVMRASRFMLTGSQLETANLRRAIESTERAINQLRHKAFADGSQVGSVATSTRIDRLGSVSSGLYSNKSGAAANLDAQGTPISDKSLSLNGISSKSEYFKTKDIALMEEEEIQKQWENHEKIVQNFLRMQEEIINEAANVRFCANPNQPRRKLFDEFWEGDCKIWSDIATATFYIGTVTLLIAAMIYMWSEFDFQYDSRAASLLAVAVIGISLIVGVFLGITLRMPLNESAQVAQAVDAAVARQTGDGMDNL